jgi:hypothetical protein
MPSKGYSRAELDAACDERATQERSRAERYPRHDRRTKLTTCAITNRLLQIEADVKLALTRTR